jgi:N12 class adenine-specific DNA methylase
LAQDEVDRRSFLVLTKRKPVNRMARFGDVLETPAKYFVFRDLIGPVSIRYVRII